MMPLVLDHYRIAGQLLGLISQQIGFGQLELSVTLDRPTTIGVRWCCNVKGKRWAGCQYLTPEMLERYPVPETLADLVASNFKQSSRTAISGDE